jgi:hypothetical protein
MTKAIPASASLALAVKLKRMFEEEDRFLTFPVGLGFPEGYFDFVRPPGESELSALELSNNRADFARQMNLIPEDRPLFSPDGSTFLWSRVRELLRACEFAESALSPSEEQRLAEAIDYLTDDQIDDDGLAIAVMSPQVRRYYEYKTLYDAADSAYLDEKLSVEFATGPDGDRLRAVWEQKREAELLGARDRAMHDWINLGFKNQVEQHQAVQAALEVRKYLETYRQAYLNEMAISEIGDVAAQGLPYLNTFFSPVDVFDPDQPWASITLTRSEMTGLIGEAPEDLRGIFGGVTQSDPALEAISLEYTKMVVIRPWYRPEFFASRYWRMRDDRVISDGKVPTQGSLPGFITNVVVARNVELVWRAETRPQAPPAATPMPLQIFLQPEAARMQQAVVRDHRTASTVRVRDHRSSAATAVLDRPGGGASRPTVSVTAARARPAMAASFVRAPAVTAPVQVRAAAAATPAPVVQSRSSFVFPATLAKAKPAPSPTIAAAVAAPQLRSYDQLKLEGLTIRSRASTVVPAVRADLRMQEDNASAVRETVALEGFSVLALTCKRVPRCPDPDQSLTWL